MGTYLIKEAWWGVTRSGSPAAPFCHHLESGLNCTQYSVVPAGRQGFGSIGDSSTGTAQLPSGNRYTYNIYLAYLFTLPYLLDTEFILLPLRSPAYLNLHTHDPLHGNPQLTCDPRLLPSQHQLKTARLTSETPETALHHGAFLVRNFRHARLSCQHSHVSCLCSTALVANRCT